MLRHLHPAFYLCVLCVPLSLAHVVKAVSVGSAAWGLFLALINLYGACAEWHKARLAIHRSSRRPNP